MSAPTIYGRPTGSRTAATGKFWERARELVGIELAGQTGQRDPNEPMIEEEPALQDNLGEFPDRFADQGERQETPRPKARKRSASSALPVRKEPAAGEDAKPRKRTPKKAD